MVDRYQTDLEIFWNCQKCREEYRQKHYQKGRQKYRQKRHQKSLRKATQEVLSEVAHTRAILSSHRRFKTAVKDRRLVICVSV